MSISLSAQDEHIVVTERSHNITSGYYEGGVQSFSTVQPSSMDSNKRGTIYHWYSEITGVKQTVHYWNGDLLHGEFQIHDDLGILRVKKRFNKGVLISRNVYDKDGTPTSYSFHDEQGVSTYEKYRTGDSLWVEIDGRLAGPCTITITTDKGYLVSVERRNEYTKHFKLYYANQFKTLKKEYHTNYSGELIGEYREYTYGSLTLRGTYSKKYPGFKIGRWEQLSWVSGEVTKYWVYDVQVLRYANGWRKSEVNYLTDVSNRESFSIHFTPNCKCVYYGEYGVVKDTVSTIPCPVVFDNGFSNLE